MTTHQTPSTTSRPSAGAAHLSEARIIEAAMKLSRSVGIEKITMRALAEELGVSPMAAYYYVPNKSALLELVAREVQGGIEPPHPDSGPWEERLWQFTKSVDDALAAYPGLIDVLIHHEITHEARRIMNDSMQILRDDGFTDEQAKIAYSAIFSYMYGRSAFAAFLARRSSVPRGQRRKGGAVERLPSLSELSSPEHRRFGYQALVLGIKAMLDVA